MAEEQRVKDFSFCLTSELDIFLRIKVYARAHKSRLMFRRCSLEGKIGLEDYAVTAQLWADNKTLGPTLRTAYRSFSTAIA